MQEAQTSSGQERKLEERHLEECIRIIEHNIEDYTKQYDELSAETKELYDNYRSSNPELHNDLVIGLDMKSQVERILNKNILALRKPYFGRIDYREEEDGSGYSLYIGKNGIRRNITENVIVDWRAPISSVYYDSEIGRSSYPVPAGDRIEIDLRLKRTYEIEDKKLVDFYDSDVVANDEFLTKYLSKNKEVVLGEIIATIQKEQNEIIRDSPWHSVIVQGVAGSGKTTVAMHRISYILYNYKDKFRPEEFFIIGSNKMLLNYITGVLPNLDVYHVNQMTMEEFLLSLLDKDFNRKTGKYTLTDSFLKLAPDRAKPTGTTSASQTSVSPTSASPTPANPAQASPTSTSTASDSTMSSNSEPDNTTTNHTAEDGTSTNDMKEAASGLKRFKGSIHFIKALAVYMKQYELAAVTSDSVEYGSEVLYSGEEISYFLNFFEDMPLQEKIDMLNKRLAYKITSVNEEQDMPKEKIRAEVNKYRNYFGSRNKKYNLMEIYLGFLEDMAAHGQRYLEQGIAVPQVEVIRLLIQELRQKRIDLYDLGVLNFIKKRVKRTRDYEYVGHIVIDEAQDFGVMLFFIFKTLFKNCTYTIMGDISQNIYYDTGMNDWEVLRQEVFRPDKDRFYVLAKSYRNTVEISDFATRVLRKCSFQTYDIEPILRHGKEVRLTKVGSEKQMAVKAAEAIRQIREGGYDTIAVICRTVEEAVSVRKLLSPLAELVNTEGDPENMSFTGGTMVLPIHMTKGLEFDAVVLWNPDTHNYRATDEDAKLLYVAITRAMHELHIVYQGELSGLLG